MNKESNNKSKINKPKVMFVCNSGGHLSEMLKLDKLFDKYNYILITEKTSITKNLNYKVRFLKYVSRKNIIMYILNNILNFLKSVYFLIRYNPRVIISTGACNGAIMCFLGKIFGKKIIFIETLASINKLSGTGKFVYKFADEFYVQWEELIEKYDKAKYLGRLI